MHWEWSSIDAGRAERALKVKIVSVDLNSNVPSGIFAGSGGAQYTCTLEDCTCPDFAINERKGNRQPCKHIIRLAMECGILNRNGRTPQAQSAYDLNDMERTLALYAWHYYILNRPDVSDKEYDDLKAQYMTLVQKVEGE